MWLYLRYLYTHFPLPVRRSASKDRHLSFRGDEKVVEKKLFFGIRDSLCYTLYLMSLRKKYKKKFFYNFFDFLKKFLSFFKNSYKSMISEVILLIRNIPHFKTNSFPKVCIELKSSICKIWGRC